MVVSCVAAGAVTAGCMPTFCRVSAKVGTSAAGFFAIVPAPVSAFLLWPACPLRVLLDRCKGFARPLAGSAAVDGVPARCSKDGSAVTGGFSALLLISSNTSLSLLWAAGEALAAEGE